MQKKLIVLAVVGAISFGALAAPGGESALAYEFYGRLNTGLDTYSATGATAGTAADFKSRSRMFDANSRLGVRGSLALSDGFKGVYQVESGFNSDTGSNVGQAGFVNASTGFIGSRPTYLGVAGPFGEVRLGRQEVFWGTSTVDLIGPDYVNTASNLFLGNGLVAPPYTRTSNVLAWYSPNFNGFTGTFGYIFDAETAGAGVNTNASGTWIRANYRNGPIVLQWDYAKKNMTDVGAATGIPDYVGNKVGVAYKYANNSQVGLMYTALANHHISAASNPGAIALGVARPGDNITQSDWVLEWEHALTPKLQSLLEYGRSGHVNGASIATTSSATESHSLMLGLRYFFSDKACFYLTYNQTTNGAKALGDYVASSYTSVGGGAGLYSAPGSAGADPRIIAVGMRYDF